MEKHIPGNGCFTSEHIQQLSWSFDLGFLAVHNVHKMSSWNKRVDLNLSQGIMGVWAAHPQS